MSRAAVLGAAAALYVLAAWTTRPGFYDGFPTPQYDYVSPPPDLPYVNTPPTSGSGDVGAAGGFVTTHDQPIAQASVGVAAAAHVEIRPFAPPKVNGITLEGNVYCVTSTAPPGPVDVSLLVPATEPFPSAMYQAPSLDGPWRSIGGSVDISTYLMAARADGPGCFAVGYPTPKRGTGISGSLLPAVVAIAIAAVLLGGLPMAVRRRYNRPRVR